MQDRMSIPIYRDYNKILKDFQIEKIKSISKDNLIKPNIRLWPPNNTSNGKRELQ